MSGFKTRSEVVANHFHQLAVEAPGGKTFAQSKVGTTVIVSPSLTLPAEVSTLGQMRAVSNSIFSSVWVPCNALKTPFRRLRSWGFRNPFQ